MDSALAPQRTGQTAAASAASAPTLGADPIVAQPLDPLSDLRWAELLAWHPDAGVFHTPAWLRALRACYGYEPLAYTSARKGEPLWDGLVFCRVHTLLSRQRLVSVPFADHCQPLLATGAEAGQSWMRLIGAAERNRRGHIEIRPLRTPWATPGGATWDASAEFALHTTPIAGAREALLRSFHKDCVQRRIRRAEREGLKVELGRSPALLDEFFALHAVTRRRHGVPPQPRAWFRHLAEELGEALTVLVARHQGRAVASIVTLLFRQRLTYKYGASDAAQHALGAMPLLMWQAIEEGRRRGAQELDLGRSELSNAGLIAFKRHWNTCQQMLTYFRSPGSGLQTPRQARWRGVAEKGAQALASRLPSPLLIAAGELLYRHIG